MNFLRNKNLKQLGAYLLALTVLIFVAQYFVIGYKIEKLEEAELKKEFTRATQFANQQISMTIGDFVNGNTANSSEISSLLEQQEHRLKILSMGGRVEQTEDFIQPLSRLPRITFLNLKEDWEQYKKSIYLILTEQKTNESASVEPVRAESDSSVAEPAVQMISVSTPVQSVAAIRFQGLSLTMKGWYDKLMVDLDEEVHLQKASLVNWRIATTLLNIVLAAAFLGLFFQVVLRPLQLLNENIRQHHHTTHFPNNELGDVAQSVNATIENLKDATDFVVAIGEGNLNICYKEAMDGNYVHGNNKLADSLIVMQNKLKALNEEEQKRQWANEGLTKFVDILRSSSDDLHVLGDKIIANLVQYTKSNQGALYILNDEDQSNKILEQISLFAFDIKKHEQQIVKPGQGILGQTFLERETTYLTDLPEEYVRITSGLGGARPKCILIVPLKVDKDVYGLVELASFNEMLPHEIAFVEKLGESIASTLASVRGVQRQKNLIEQFQMQTEQMRAQEEEMKQNMEELQATQEEVVRKERSYIARIDELENELRTNSGNADVESIKRAFDEKEHEYQRKIAELQVMLNQQNVKSDDWEVVQQLEGMLRTNLEALKITEEELSRKRT